MNDDDVAAGYVAGREDGLEEAAELLEKLGLGAAAESVRSLK